jgi:hypothetical protein
MNDEHVFPSHHVVRVRVRVQLVIVVVVRRVRVADVNKAAL